MSEINNKNSKNTKILDEYKFCEVIEHGAFSKILKGKTLNQNEKKTIKEIIVDQNKFAGEKVLDNFEKVL